MKTDSDSEGEVSSDPDVAVRLSNGLTRSVFNITLDLPDDETNKNNENTDYQERLNAEIHEWLSLLKKIKQTVSNTSSATKTADYSVLPPEKLAYLMRAPSLTEFVDESIEFRKEADVYMNDYAEILEMHENLVELCHNRLDNQKSQLIERMIFSNQTSHREIN